MSRKAFICKDTPGGMHCMTVIVADDVEEVVEKAKEHIVDAHDVDDTPELRQVILASLEAEESEVEEMDREDNFDMVHPHFHPEDEEDVDDEAEARGGFSVEGFSTT